MSAYSLLLATIFSLSGASDSTSLSTPIPTDPKVRIGSLANGMRYFIRRNDTPRKRAELRLVVNAGSILETDSQLGYAHFIEHMAFNGTDHFPKNDLVQTLQSLGVRFGADLNAQTSFDETIYILPVPTDQPRIVDIALTILADWAGGQRFDSAEVVGERGVVREEWRGSTGAGERMLKQWLPIALDGSLYAKRIPIGNEKSIMSATPSALRDYYKAWYRPDLMAVVAVGDFDAAEMEEKIRKVFSAIPAVAAPRSRAVSPGNEVDSTRIVVATDPEATQTGVSIWSRATRQPMKTVADYREDLVARLFFQILNERLNEDAQRSDPPFIQASASRQTFVARDLMSFSVNARVKKGGVPRAVESLTAEIARAAQAGFDSGEVERARSRVLQRYRAANAEAATTPSSAFANEYIRSFLVNEPAPGVDFEYRMVKELLPGIASTEVQEIARRWASEEDRVVIVQAPASEAGASLSRDEIKSAIARGLASSTSAAGVAVTTAPMIASMRPAGRVVSRTSIPNVGVTEWKLSNGARVLVKPTDFQTDEILFGAYAPGGTSLAPDSVFLSAAVSSQLVSLFGLGSHSLADLQRQLAGKSVSINASIGESATELTGRTSVDDLETLLQLAYLEFTAARVDTAAFSRYIANVRSGLSNRAASPDAVFADTVQTTMSQNAFRSRPVTEQRLTELDPRKAVAFFKERMANAGAFTFYFIGNVDSASLELLTNRYLASLPVAAAKETRPHKEPGPPVGVIQKTVKMGLEPRATTLMIFSGRCRYTPGDRFALRAVTDALQLQLIRTLREQLGRTYSPSVRGSCIGEPRNQYAISIQFTSAPADADTLAKTVLSLVEDLRKKGPTESDVQTVKEQMVRSREVDLRQNAFWLASIMLRDRAHEDLSDIVQASEHRIRSLRAQDLRDAALTYLNTQNYARFVLRPEM